MSFYNGKQVLLAGLKGDSVFIRYSANADGTDFTDTWSEGQGYMGVATGQTAPTDKTKYNWLNINGAAPKFNIEDLEKIPEIEQSITTLNTDVDNLEEKIETINDKIPDIEQSITTLNTDVDNLEEKVETKLASTVTMEATFEDGTTATYKLYGEIVT